jgi:hypothetical protein
MTSQNTSVKIARAEMAASQSLFRFLLDGLEVPGQGTRAEEAISSAASIVAWRCIEAAGDYDPRNHQLVPGSRVFSTRVNELFSGDDDKLSAAPPDSIVGILRGRLLGRGYSQEDFPELAEVFRDLAAKIGDPADWGRAPLSVPEDNRPALLPLQVEFETRATVDQLFAGLKGDKMRCLKAATLALAEVLVAVEHVIDHRVALLLALETINGMAKTAPMTQQAWSQAAAEADAARSSPPEPAPRRPWWRFW